MSPSPSTSFPTRSSAFLEEKHTRGLAGLLITEVLQRIHPDTRCPELSRCPTTCRAEAQPWGGMGWSATSLGARSCQTHRELRNPSINLNKFS